MSYTSGSHTVFHHRDHIVWITKYRYKVLEGALRERIRTIIRQVCKELGVQIVSGVLSREHIHMFVEIAYAGIDLVFHEGGKPLTSFSRAKARLDALMPAGTAPFRIHVQEDFRDGRRQP